MVRKASPKSDVAEGGATTKTYPCPDCGRDSEPVRFVGHEIILREDQTFEDLLTSATYTSNAKAPEARNILVKCPVHGEKNFQHIGNHVTGSKKARP